MILGFDRNAATGFTWQFLKVVGLGVLLSIYIEAQSEIDMLVVYTQAVEDYYGDEDGVLAQVQSSIVSANTGFGNSANTIQLVLRDLQKISYVEGGSLPNDLTYITSSSEVAGYRDQVGADLVCLFRNGNAGGLSGYGWILGNESGDPGGGFSVVGAQSAVSTLTFQHEVGHNLGGAHDRDNASVDGLYSYSYGHRFVGGDSTQYRTIMSYAPGQSINYFSNPDIDFQGTPTGVASGVSSADNARTFNMIASVVEAYRDRVVKGSNSSPTLVQSISDQVASVDTSFDLDVSSNFNDIDIGDTLSFSATNDEGAPLPLWLSLGSVTGAFSGTPSDSDVGTIVIEVTASDGEASVSDAFELIVEFANTPPVLLSPIGDQAAYVDTLFSLDVSGNFEDADGDPLQYGAALNDEDPLPDWLEIDFDTGVFSGTPTSSDVGTLTILVGAFDGDEVAIDNFALTIGFPNQDPVVAVEIPDQMINEDSPFSLDISSNFEDTDPGDTLTFAVALEGGGDLPAWVDLDEGTGIFSGTPLNDDVAALSIEVTASDGQASIADVFILTVENVNDSPVVVTPVSDQFVVEDIPFVLDVSPNFGDVDVGGSLSFEVLLEGGGTLPGWIEVDDVLGILSGTPSNGDVGSLSVEVFASDGELTASDVFELVVGNSNDIPLLLLEIPDQSTTEDESFLLDVSSNFGDPDLGDVLSFTGTLENGNALPGWLSLDSGTGAFSGTPSNGDVDSLSIKLTAYDGEASVSDVFGLIVENSNDAPLLVSPILDQEANEDTPFSLDVSENFSDVDTGDTLSFAATLEGGDPLPTWLVFDSVLGGFSGLPSNDDVGSLLIEVEVSDGEISVSDEFRIVVANVNDAPTLVAAIPDQEIQQDEVFSLDVSSNFEDVDLGDSLSFSATLVLESVLPTWLDLDSVSGVLTGTSKNEDVGSVTIEVTASDGEMSVSDLFDLTVSNVNDEPTLVASIQDQNAIQDMLFSLDVSSNFGDVDTSDTISFAATLEGGALLPLWTSFDTSSGVFTGTPGNVDVGEIEIEVTASDGLATVSDVFTLVVENVNDAPSILEPLADQVILEGEGLELNTSPYFEDIDVGDVLSFSASLVGGETLPDWLKFDTASGIFTGSPDVEDLGLIAISLSVTDGEFSVSDDFTIRVKSANSPPILVSEIEDYDVEEGESFSLNLSPYFNDDDEGDTLLFEAELEGGGPLPIWIELNVVTGEFSGVPNREDVGIFSILVSASDGLESVSDVFSVEVINVNNSPIVVSDFENVMVQEGDQFVYSVSEFFEDPDEEDLLTYFASLESGEALPAWLKFDSSSGTFSGVPWRNGGATLSIQISASDGEESVAGEFLLQIVSSLKIVKIGHDLYLELNDPISSLSYELWESKDLVNWGPSNIQSDRIDGTLRFDIPNDLSCWYRAEVSE